MCLPKSKAVERRGMRMTSAWLGAAAALALPIIGLGWPSVEAAEKVSGQLSVRDALTVPGRPVRIEGRLVKAGLLDRLGLGGEQLELLVGGTKVGLAMTGGDGRAFFDTTCRLRGVQTLTLRVADSPRVESPDVEGVLACWERRRAIMLVDLTALIHETTPPFGVPSPLPRSLRTASPDPMADAPEELKRLTDYFYNVLYLSWSKPDTWPGEQDTRAWLQRMHFPTGVLVTVPPGQAGLSEFLDRLKAEGWDNLKVGVGRTKEFAETLASHRIEAVILPASSRDERVPKKTHVIKDWKEIRKKLRS